MSQLSLDQALGAEQAQAIVVLERLRRWLELRPGLSLTFTTKTSSDGQLQSAVLVGWSYETAPPKMAGTWASVCDVDRTTWPLHAALSQACRAFEAAECRGEAP